MVGIQDTETHLRRRKNWNRGMGPAAVREYEHFIAKRARQLVERLEEQQHKGGAVVIGNWFNYFSCVFSFFVVYTTNRKQRLMPPKQLRLYE